MGGILSGREPQSVLAHFEDICSIPHGFNCEAALGAHIAALAESLGYAALTDEAGNVFVTVPASMGFENAPPLLVQGHLDMVSVGLMPTEPVRLVVDGDVLRADNTTLGSDNGIGVAIMLALMTDGEVSHPKLELLFTTGEETGLTGVKAFDMSRITARRMINMDCGDPDLMVTGGAGIARYALKRRAERSPFFGKVLNIEITGLLGGHSGIDIDQNRASAGDLAGRLLFALAERVPVRLVSMSVDSAGGIPDSARLALALPSENARAALDIFADEYAAFKSETRDTDGGFRMTASESAAECFAASVEDTRAIADMLLLAPYGVIRRSEREPFKPRCSAMLHTASYTDGSFSGELSVRANLDAYADACLKRLRAASRLTGFELTVQSSAPAWPENADSELRRVCGEAFSELYGRQMRETVIHGLVEVGVIRRAIPEMDCIGFAPLARGAHTREERLYLDALPAFWEHFKAVLRKL